MKIYHKEHHEIVELIGMEIIDDRTFLRIQDSNGICKCEIESIKNFTELFSDVEEEFDDGSLLINYENEEIRTNCGDYYYDFDISFEKIKELAKKIGVEK